MPQSRLFVLSAVGPVGPVGPAGPAGAAGAAGTNGKNAFTTVAAIFTQPAVNATQLMQVADSSWAGLGQIIFVENGGYYSVAAIPDATHLNLENIGYSGNAAPGAFIAVASKVVPGGLKGVDGINAFTTVGAAFIMPGVGLTDNLPVNSTAWMAIGQTIFIETLGYVTVVSFPFPLIVEVRNPGYAVNAPPGSGVLGGERVTPAGPVGP